MTTANKNKYSKGTHISKRKFRHLLVNNTDDGEFELDESYFGCKRGRGAAGKIPVFPRSHDVRGNEYKSFAIRIYIS